MMTKVIKFKKLLFVIAISYVLSTITINASIVGDKFIDFTSGVEGTDSNKPYTLHFVCHSHDDSGWLSTIDGYYSQKVSNILNGVTNALDQNQNRKFIWSEIGFLQKWWSDASPSMRQKFKDAVLQKRMEFVNGGWVMSDEACTSVEAFIQNLEEGNRFITETFGKDFIPMSGWQIDPFGHAAKTAALETFNNYRNLILHRINTRVRDQLIENLDMNFVWRGSHGNDSEIFAHVLDDSYFWGSAVDNYYYPTSYFVNEVLTMANKRRNHYRHPHILLTVGGDFKFILAEESMKNIGAAIDEINNNPNGLYNAKFSTLFDYFQSVKKWYRETKTPIKHQYSNVDFMPYIEFNVYYQPDNWVGYYTTNPTIKGESRKLTSLQRLGEIMNAQHPIQGQDEILRDTLRNSSYIQHHDSITGTHLVHVGDDYLRRIQYAVNQIRQSIVTSLNGMAQQNSKLSVVSSGDARPMVFINPLAWDRDEVVSIVLGSPSNPHFCPFIFHDDATNTIIPAECIVSGMSGNYNYTIYFVLTIPALSTKTIRIQYITLPNENSKLIPDHTSTDKVLGNSHITINLNDNHLIESIVDNNGQYDINQKIMRYETRERNAAYLFRPKTSAIEDDMADHEVTFNIGNIVKQARIFYGNNNEVVIRIFNTGNKEIDENIDIIYTLPDQDDTDRIVRFATGFKNSHIYSDDGFEMKERPIMFENLSADRAYVPSVTSAYIKDDASGNSFVCHTDRSKGAAGIGQGNLEFEITRSSNYDDGKGLDYPSMPKRTNTIHHRCRIDTNPADYKRKYYLFSEPFHGVSEGLISNYKLYSKLETVMQSLPKNLHLLTFKKFDDEYLIRLHNIQPPEIGQPITVDVLNLFVWIRPTTYREMFLSGNEQINFDDCQNPCETVFNCTYQPIITDVLGRIGEPPIPTNLENVINKAIQNGMLTIHPNEIKTIRFSTK